MCCGHGARINSRALSLKPGNHAGCNDKETIMAKKPTKTAKGTKRTTKAAPKPETKQNIVLAMLRRANGASVAEIIAATDWQPHSVRGFFAGALKKRLKIDVVSDKGEDGIRRYYVATLASK
jgi:hypothetical protein